jgi:drug/metabolite transporter (DMT)-like permease
MKRHISRPVADLGLLSVTVFWGSTFILSKQVLNTVPLPLFLVIRLSMAAVIMLSITLILRPGYSRQTLYHGMILGVLLYLSYFFQMWGIQFTSASNAGFITGLSVIFVPVFSVLLFKDPIKINVVAGIVLATIGLLMLSGGNPLNWNRGDYLVLICAISVTFHVILTGIFARRNDVYLLTAVQLGTIAIISIIVFLFSDLTFEIPPISYTLILIYLAVFGTVYTFFMQTAMQRYTTATRTALVFSMEPVFASLFAYLIAGELLSKLAMVGGILILAGMLSAEIDWFSVTVSSGSSAEKDK